MIEDIRALTAQLAADPASLVFLRLGEALRRRGQLDAAQKVALAGLAHYPHLPDAHDLYGRILTDRRDYASAFDEWDMTLRLDPNHVGGHKGIGFLYVQAGEWENALHHLRTAFALQPEDEGLRDALDRLSRGVVSPLAAAEPAPESSAEPAPERPGSPREEPRAGSAGPPAELDVPEERLLLLDTGGLRLAGGLTDREGNDVSDIIAARVASATQEATRTAKLLKLGEWQSLLIESADLNLCFARPTSDTCLIAARDPAVPVAQLGYIADHAAKAARGWLERMR